MAKVVTKAVREERGSGWAIATAVVSSMTPWAASSLRGAAYLEEVGQAQAVQGVAAAQQQRAQAGGQQIAARAHRARQRELRGARERQQAQHARLRHGQARGDRRGAEGEPGQPHGQAHAQTVPHCRGTVSCRFHASRGYEMRECRFLYDPAARWYAAGGTPTTRLKCRLRCA
ncbi:hypothetical protein GCM10020001_082600 [Nonomuraea salmonea]